VNGIEFGGKSLEYVVEQMELLMENETIVILLFLIEIYHWPLKVVA